MPDGFELEAHGFGTTDQRRWDHFYTARFPDGTSIDVTHRPAPDAAFELYLRPANDRPITAQHVVALARYFRVGPARVSRLAPTSWHEWTSGGSATAGLERELAAAAAAGFDPISEEQATTMRERIAAFLAEGDALAVANEAEDIALGRRHLTVLHGDPESRQDTDRLGALYRAIDGICQGRERRILDSGDVLSLTVAGDGAEQVIDQVERAALELGFWPRTARDG
jgi:hypothetical protein